MSSIKFLTVFTFCSVLIGSIQNASAKQPTKIVGGKETSIENFPSMASIRVNKKHLCGGSLITKRHVLTAAHCVVLQLKGSITYDMVMPADIFEVFVGTNSSGYAGLPIKVRRVHLHEGYTGDRNTIWKNDIAVLTLKTPVRSTEAHKPIALPSSDVTPGAIGDIVGWGYVADDGPVSKVLRQAKTKIYGNDKCSKTLKESVHDTQLCGIHYAGTGFCDGDSGGPLIVNDEIVGIISNSVGCGWGIPEIYTRVYSYVHWINKVLEDDYYIL